MPDAGWVGIRRASEILGVRPSTLREWTRAGRLEAFVTPGGHRRYRASDLQAFPDGGRSDDTAASLAGALLGCQQACGLGGACALEDSAWLDDCDEATRRRLRLLGASLLRLLLAYLLAEHDADGERALARAREDAAEYGALTAQLGLVPSAAIGAFTRCRLPILRAAHQWTETHPSDGSLSGRALTRVHRFLDQALVSMVAAHDRAPRERTA